MDFYEGGVMGMIREVYPVSFIMIVLTLVTYGIVTMTWRPYIRSLQKQLTKIQDAKLGKRDEQ